MLWQKKRQRRREKKRSRLSLSRRSPNLQSQRRTWKMIQTLLSFRTQARPYRGPTSRAAIRTLRTRPWRFNSATNKHLRGTDLYPDSSPLWYPDLYPHLYPDLCPDLSPQHCWFHMVPCLLQYMARWTSTCFWSFLHVFRLFSMFLVFSQYIRIRRV